jgi:hypothetical protein
MATAESLNPEFEPADIMRALYGDGITALKGAFTREWAERMREDIDGLFAEAQAVPGGALPRGPQRWYVEVHPERIRGFVDIATHPWFVAVITRSSRSASTFPFLAPPTSPGTAISSFPRRPPVGGG